MNKTMAEPRPAPAIADNATIASRLHENPGLLGQQGDDRFRSRAFHEAAH
jgi:hypothetical protein